MTDARTKPGVLGVCLLALIDGDAENEDQTDRQAGAFVVAEWMQSFLKKG